MRRASLPVWILPCLVFLPVPGPAAPEPPKRTPELRLLSLSDDVPLRYEVGPGGKKNMIIAGSDEVAPRVVYTKIGETYAPVVMPKNNLGPAMPIRWDKASKSDGYFIRVEKAIDSNAAWDATRKQEQDRAGGGQPKSDGKAEAKPEGPVWAPLAPAAPRDGKDYLLCIYQPSTKAKWYPPKTEYVDVSPEVFPAGAILLCNYSHQPVVFKPVANLPEVVLAPGGRQMLPPVKSPDLGMVQAASQSKEGKPIIIYKRQLSMEVGSRAVFAAYSLYDKAKPASVGAKFLSLPVPAVPAVAPAPKK